MSIKNNFKAKDDKFADFSDGMDLFDQSISVIQHF